MDRRIKNTMKRKSKRKKEAAAPLPQLCLFDEKQMDEMIEPPPEKPADPLPVDPDPGWIQWQLLIGEALRGKAWRQHRAMLLAGKKEKTRVPVVPGRIFY